MEEEQKYIAERIINNTLDKPSATDKQIADIEGYGAFEMRKALVEIDKALGEVERNNIKLRTLEDPLRYAKMLIENLATDWEKDAKISE